MSDKKYPEIYGIKTPERHTIGGSPDLETVYRELHRVGKAYDDTVRREAINKMIKLRDEHGANWFSYWSL